MSLLLKTFMSGIIGVSEKSVQGRVTVDVCCNNAGTVTHDTETFRSKNDRTLSRLYFGLLEGVEDMMDLIGHDTAESCIITMVNLCGDKQTAKFVRDLGHPQHKVTQVFTDEE